MEQKVRHRRNHPDRIMYSLAVITYRTEFVGCTTPVEVACPINTFGWSFWTTLSGGLLKLLAFQGFIANMVIDGNICF